MSTVRLLGVSRSSEFSPNMTGADQAVFQAVCQVLTRSGCEVVTVSESSSEPSWKDVSAIFTMARSRHALQWLTRASASGIPVINSPACVARCSRETLTRLFAANGVLQPEWWIGHPGDAFLPLYRLLSSCGTGCWLKRADRPVSGPDDMVYVSDSDTLRAVLQLWSDRGVGWLVANAHLPGDLIKFYGVAGTPFFHWFYPSDRGHSKFGFEAVNGLPQRFPFEVGQLQAFCNRAASLAGIPVYGGDCVLSSDGIFRIIDFNDWPSFSPCRDEAAVAIARLVGSAAGLPASSFQFS